MPTRSGMNIFSPRFFALGQVAFDHNFAQDLDLQQIYGGGFGWTFLKTPNQEADLKATIQYEKQQFISGWSSEPESDRIDDLPVLHSSSQVRDLHAGPGLHSQRSTTPTPIQRMKPIRSHFRRTRTSASRWERWTAISTITPASLPPTKHNSFQFTMGLTYAIKSKY